MEMWVVEICIQTATLSPNVLIQLSWSRCMGVFKMVMWVVEFIYHNLSQFNESSYFNEMYRGVENNDVSDGHLFMNS